MRSVSQLGQDHWVLNLLNSKTNGIFVEIGASDGIHFSNTYLLEKHYNWRGLCIEPSSEYFNLQRNRNCLTSDYVIFSQDDVILDFIEDEINDNKKSFSGIVSLIDKHKVQGPVLKKRTKTLTSLLDELHFDKHIDYMSLDTEGSEYEILLGIDFSKYFFSLISIEHNWVEPKRTEIWKYLLSKGYHLDTLSDSKFDDWYIHHSVLSVDGNNYFQKIQNIKEREIEARKQAQQNEVIIERLNHDLNNSKEELEQKEKLINNLVQSNLEITADKNRILNSYTWRIFSKLTLIPYYILNKIRVYNVDRLFKLRTNRAGTKIKEGNSSKVAADPVNVEIKPNHHVIYKKGLGALAIPCTLNEKKNIIENFELWDKSYFSPYLNGPKNEDKIPIVIIVNSSKSSEFESDIRNAYSSTKNVIHQFSAVHFYYCNLSGENDIYENDYSKKAGNQGYKSGPNNQFFMAMNLLQYYGEYSFYMEADCYPVRPGWLEHVSGLVANGEKFWIMGSVYRGVSVLDERIKTHFNGNAIYGSGFSDFQYFLSNTMRPHLLEWVEKECPWLAYDCVIDYLFHQAVSGQNKEHWERLQSIYHLLKPTNFIQNHSGHSENHQGKGYSLQKIMTENEDTYLVHGKHLKKELMSVIYSNRTTP